MDCNNNNHEPSGCWAGKQRLGVAERLLELLSSDRAVIGAGPVGLEPRLERVYSSSMIWPHATSHLSR